MIGCLGRTIGRLVGVVLLAAIIWVAWNHGPELSHRFFGTQAGTDETQEPSAALATEAVDRYQLMVEGDAPPDRSYFTGSEVESLLRFTVPGYLPAGVADPTVRFNDGEAIVGVRVSRDLLPDVQELERVLEILPDTVPVQVRGTLVPGREGETALVIRRIDVSGIPIPRRFFARIIAALDPRATPGLPAEAVAVPLPEGMRSVLIEGDRLMITMIR